MNLNALSQLIYEELIHCSCLGNDQIYFNALNELRNTLIRHGDPLISMKISNTDLTMNLSHQMPWYDAQAPLCGTVLPRVAKTIFQQDKYLKVIDIGANIGDSVAAISQEVPGAFLCVEGDKHYFSLLQENVKSMNGRIVCVDAICGDSDREAQGYILTECGTGHFVEAIDKETVLITSVKTILEKNTFFKDANLIKVDTDGFDPYVLRGAREYLADTGPTIFFEFAPVLLQNPFDVFPYLADLGYRHSLFYALDYPLEIVDICNQKKLEDMVKGLSSHKVDFYDILLPGHTLSHGSFIKFYKSEVNVTKKILAGSKVNNDEKY